MNKTLMLVGVLALAIGIAAAAPDGAPNVSGPLSPDVWVHEADSDGDGLTDAFEVAHGLDPLKASSFADGTPDEFRRGPDGRTMWEVQESEKGSAAAVGRAGGGACGATGLEALLVLLLARIGRRSV